VTARVGPVRTARGSPSPVSSTRSQVHGPRSPSLRTSHAGARRSTCRARCPFAVGARRAPLHCPALAGIRNSVRNRTVVPGRTRSPLASAFCHLSLSGRRPAPASSALSRATCPSQRTNAAFGVVVPKSRGTICRRSNPRPPVGSRIVTPPKSRLPGPSTVPVGTCAAPSVVSVTPEDADRATGVSPSPSGVPRSPRSSKAVATTSPKASDVAGPSFPRPAIAAAAAISSTAAITAQIQVPSRSPELERELERERTASC
jgi:hypothetical protein